MQRVLTATEARSIDQAAAEQGTAVSTLMENAGRALADAALANARADGRVWVLCGLGHNGGDGLVAARMLAAAGRQVRVELVVSAALYEDLPGQMLAALQAAGVSPAPIELEARVGDVVIDALLGTGLNRAPEGPYAEAIKKIQAWRAAGAKVVSADLPSGVQSDTGQVFDPAVQADLTVAFDHLKVGEVLEPGVSRCGRVQVSAIGVPRGALAAATGPRMYLLEESDAVGHLAPRGVDSHKGTYGHLLVVAGSRGKSGAAALSGMAALRAGAGLVTVATRPEALGSVLGFAPELMGLELPNPGPLGLADTNALLEAADGKDALVLGPGIPRGDETYRWLGAVLEELTLPCVLDADALNAVAGHLEVLEQAKTPLILTPHPGEMARLVGKTVAEVQADRVGVARALATRYHVVVVLKGARTVVASEDGTVYVNPTGNPGMATGGSGDVLSGICGALLAQGLAPADAALTAVYAHGLAGDLAVARTGQLGLVASDLLAGLQQVWVRWSR